jgi:hypothetical protein
VLIAAMAGSAGSQTLTTEKTAPEGTLDRTAPPRFPRESADSYHSPAGSGPAFSRGAGGVRAGDAPRTEPHPRDRRKR